MYLLQQEREEKNEEIQIWNSQKAPEENEKALLKNFSVLPVNAMHTVFIHFDEEAMKSICTSNNCEFSTVVKKKLPFLIIIIFDSLLFDQQFNWNHFGKKLKPPKFNYDFNKQDEGWFLESIRTDGVCIELLLKLFVLRSAKNEDIEHDMANRSEGKKRQYKTQHK